jgi:hypothetical protein
VSLKTTTIAMLLAALFAASLAATDYDLTWHTIDGGGGTSVGGAFELSGTIGQPDAATMSGGGFTLAGGFWSGSTEPSTPPCLGDINSDGVIDVSDLLVLLGAWGSCPGCAADINGDGVVDVSDLLVLLGAWGPCS